VEVDAARSGPFGAIPTLPPANARAVSEVMTRRGGFSPPAMPALAGEGVLAAGRHDC